MVDAERFVDGTSVSVGRVVATIVGGILISYAAGAWQFFETVAGLIGRFYTAPARVGTELVTRAVMIPINMLEASWASAAEWIAGPGASLGIWLFPLTIAVVAVVLLILDWGLRNMGVLD